MEITILLDNDLDGFARYFEVGLRETGWDQIVICHFKRLRDYGLPVNHPDQEIWRFVQAQGLWLVTNNRNGVGETSLQVTLQCENTPECLPVITISDKERLRVADYRQRVTDGLIDIVISPEKYRGTGRLFLPQ